MHLSILNKIIGQLPELYAKYNIASELIDDTLLRETRTDDEYPGHIYVRVGDVHALQRYGVDDEPEFRFTFTHTGECVHVHAVTYNDRGYVYTEVP